MDRPIIFSAPMVLALLAGRKAQTRRVLKGSIPDAPAMDEVHEGNARRHAAPYLDAYCGEPLTPTNPRGMGDHWCWWTLDDRPGRQFKVGFRPGDRLWVREGWAGDAHLSIYRAGHEEAKSSGPRVDMRWRAPIHMPRAASRLSLTVTDVRVQRVWDISAADTIAEGAECMTCRAMGRSACLRLGCFASREAFRALWNSIHGAGAWDENPYVAALTFDVHRGNIDAIAMPPARDLAAPVPSR